MSEITYIILIGLILGLLIFLIFIFTIEDVFNSVFKAKLENIKKNEEEQCQKKISNISSISTKEIEEKNKALEKIKSMIKTPTPWVCGIDGMFGPTRVNANKEIECMSTNGFDCIWANTLEDCKNNINNNDPISIIPNTCTDDLYNQEGHWCQRSKNVYGI